MSMDLTVVDGPLIRRFAPYSVLVPLIAQTMQAVSNGEAELPLRQAMPIPGTPNRLGMMAGFLAPADAAGVKLVGLVPDAAARGQSSHIGLIVLFEGTSLTPIALLCGATITVLRTAAASAVATHALARPDATTLAVLGAGEQAEAHVEALRTVRPLTDIRIWARRPEQAVALAARVEAQGPRIVRAVSTLVEALHGADIVCTATSAAQPLFDGALIAPGTHVNLVGSSIPAHREVDDTLVARSRFFVDYRRSAMNQAGELLGAIAAGRVTADHIQGEIGEVLAGRVAGRTDPGQITIYKSLGVAAQDLATARFVLTKARAAGVGQTVHMT